MKIVNPIYDQSFKYLMDNEIYAKRILSIILDTEVVEVTQVNQEMRVPAELRSFSLYRLDFRAMIMERDGSRKTVLIELQKSKQPTDIIRFRNYLAANYHVMRNKDSVTEPATGYGNFYPIITVYLLGYQLKDLPYMAVKVDREVINLTDQKQIKAKSSFIEYLTHQSYIIQLTRLPERPETPIERLFSLFNQRWRTDDGFIIDLPEVPDGFFDMVSYLQQPLLSDEFRNLLDFEYEADVWGWMQDQKVKRLTKKLEKIQRKTEKVNRELEEVKKIKDETIQQKEEAIQQKEEAIQQKEEAIQHKEEADLKAKEAKLQWEEVQQRVKEEQKLKKIALERTYQMALKLAMLMKSQGASHEEICKETGLKMEVIESVIKP
jgi:hypothetical protein